MSWHFSRALVEEFSEATCSDGGRSAPSSGSLTPQAYLSSDRMKAFFRLSRSGMTFVPSTDGLGEDLLTWFLEDFLVKTSLPPDPEKESMEVSLGCGVSLPASLAKYDQRGCWLKTPTTSELKVLDEFSKIWPASGMMLRGECFPLKTAAPIMSENECGLLEKLPTPTAHNAKEGAYPAEGNRKTQTLAWVLGGKINPQFTEWMMRWPIGWTDLKPLETDKFLSWQQSHFPN